MFFVQHHIILVAFICAGSILMGCEKLEREKNVSEAMNAFEIEFKKANERGGGEPEILLANWKSIDVSNTPADFQIAWSEAYRAYQTMVFSPPKKRKSESVDDFLARFNREVGNNVSQAQENLYIIAAQYVPKIKSERDQLKAIEREFHQKMSKQQ